MSADAPDSTETPSGGDPDALRAEALRLTAMGRHSKAWQAWEAAAAAAPERVDLLLRLAHARLEAGDVPGTLDAYQRALALEPSPEVLKAEALDPLDDLLSRRSTFKNAVKVRKALLEGKMPKLRERPKPDGRITHKP